ncbi:hypothetical protein EDD22DRAFT_962558 [Suillus occidentalis]|nr:hypothetical protein EDD22DRAFT_962558 [Suillus occidentalis]
MKRQENADLCRSSLLSSSTQRLGTFFAISDILSKLLRFPSNQRLLRHIIRSNIQRPIAMNQLLTSPTLRKEIGSHLSLLDLHNLSSTCRNMRRTVAKMHYDSFQNMLRPYAVGYLADLERAITNSGAVVVGSTALALILRPALWQPKDLNLVVPRGLTDPLQLWLLKNGFCATHNAQNTSIAPSMQNSVNSHRKFSHKSRPRLYITLTESVDDTILTVVLAGRTTAEKIYATAGGIFCAHPRLTFDRIVIPGFYGNLDSLTSTRRDWYSEKKMLYMPTTAGWDDECGRDCPMLWNSVEDTKQTLIIDWIDKEWQTNNQARCPSWHIAHFDYIKANFLLVVQRTGMIYYEPDIVWQLIGGGRRGVLYATSCHKPFLVPVPLMIGVNEMTTTDHLYTHPWVNEFGRDAAVVHPRMFRNTFSTHPAKKTPLPFTLVEAAL